MNKSKILIKFDPKEDNEKPKIGGLEISMEKSMLE